MIPSERKKHYMSVTCAVNIIVRTPFPMPRWRLVLRAMTPVMHRHGLMAKDICALDGLLPSPDSRDWLDEGKSAWTDDDRSFADRLDRAFKGDETCAPKFNLYDWRGGKFVRVRGAVES